MTNGRKESLYFLYDIKENDIDSAKSLKLWNSLCLAHCVMVQMAYGSNGRNVHIISMSMTQMTEVPDNRMSQMAEF